MNKIFGIIVIIFTIVSCNNDTKPFVDVSNVNVDVKIDRFEQQFYTENGSNLNKLKNKYSYLLPAQNPDSI